MTDLKMVQLGGLEPPTSGSTIRRSNQLSYNCTVPRGERENMARTLQKQGIPPPASTNAPWTGAGKKSNALGDRLKGLFGIH